MSLRFSSPYLHAHNAALSSVVHKETQGHKYGLNWQSLREGRTCQGGDFFVAQYGIMMEASHDCLFSWMPEDYHCSSLGTFDPLTDFLDDDNPAYNQHSIAFVTSSRIRSVYRKYKEAQGLTGLERMEQARAEYESHPSDVDGDLSDNEDGTEGRLDW